MKRYEKGQLAELLGQLSPITGAAIADLLGSSKTALSAAASENDGRRPSPGWDPWLERLEEMHRELMTGFDGIPEERRLSASQAMKAALETGGPWSADPSEGWRRLYLLLEQRRSASGRADAQRVDQLIKEVSDLRTKDRANLKLIGELGDSLRSHDATIKTLREKAAKAEREASDLRGLGAGAPNALLKHLDSKQQARFWKLIALLPTTSGAADGEVSNALATLRRLLTKTPPKGTDKPKL